MIVLVIVLASAVLSFVQEYRAGRAVEKLRAQVPSARVLRDGQPVTIPAEEVVPGDVVLLSAGSLIPADGVRAGGQDFFVNQAVLTGETFPVEKKPAPSSARRAGLAERTNCVFMGTSVRSGTARVLIVQTGARHRVRPDRRAADAAPARDRVRARHPPLRLPAHADHAAAGAGRLCRQRLLAQAADRLAAVRHRPGGRARAGAAAGDHQHQPVRGRAGHGRSAASSCAGSTPSRTSAAWTCSAPTRPAR